MNNNDTNIQKTTENQIRPDSLSFTNEVNIFSFIKLFFFY
jgi:hypothetical protein